ncbi:UNVERIFIED_ORG: hypothetical protein GGI57_006627 [Rhizobium aethiopicum]|jgi:hypothetical protein|uniref:Uncharacterized protein n=2 Tax=Rhizobium TaxID=379 RepID=A0A7W6VFQ9_RHIET|nr:hypothetical protein [Rhizobium aethiopicum]MBB4300742.1 hypothetical protein [Rhizobium leguminosarum]MBB4436272.1 hypothetical protein [Rhizobium esperanzae]MBB4483396.1 hypothetical protein [Rhizobium etli]MBB4421435.1 hypothetical protein [Rhizobium leguminosarum]
MQHIGSAIAALEWLKRLIDEDDRRIDPYRSETWL